MLRRGPGAKFMPNSLVFPGGVLDESDLRFPREKTDFTEGEVYGERSPIRLGLDDDLALRVCAIRELFEEGGLLPVVEGDKPFLANAEGDVHLAEWRRKIMAEPESFVQLFHNRFKMSVSSLIPWSNWLTPLASPSVPRFDTAFFLLPLATQKQPKVGYCTKEMTEANWAEPSETIRKNAQSEVSLPPPQFYELLRIQRLKCVQNDKIQNMIDPRRITPHIFRSIDEPGSNVHVLPGDHLYDETNADFTPPTFGHGKELNPPYPEDRTKPIHRILFYSEQKPLQYHKLKLFVRNFDSSSKNPHLFHTNNSSVNTTK